MTLLKNALKTPSSFADDAGGWLRNQAGHAYVVGGLGVALGVYVWGLVVMYAMWEFIQWRRYGADAWDCLEDMAHVTMGALIVAGGYAFIAPHAMLLASGYLRRRK